MYMVYLDISCNYLYLLLSAELSYDCPHLLPDLSPLNILKRYFGHYTTWYLHSTLHVLIFLTDSHAACLIMLRVTHQHLKVVFFDN